MASTDGFRPTTRGILFSNTASQHIFLFPYLASPEEALRESNNNIFVVSSHIVVVAGMITIN